MGNNIFYINSKTNDLVLTKVGLLCIFSRNYPRISTTTMGIH